MQDGTLDRRGSKENVIPGRGPALSKGVDSGRWTDVGTQGPYQAAIRGRWCGGAFLEAWLRQWGPWNPWTVSTLAEEQRSSRDSGQICRRTFDCRCWKALEILPRDTVAFFQPRGGLEKRKDSQGSRLASLQPGSEMGQRIQGFWRAWMPAAWPRVSWALSPLLKTLSWLPVTLAQMQGQTPPWGYQGPAGAALCWPLQPPLESRPKPQLFFLFLDYAVSSVPPGLCPCCSLCLRYPPLPLPSPSPLISLSFSAVDPSSMARSSTPSVPP